jgi:thiamine-monophosphate kinase
MKLSEFGLIGRFRKRFASRSPSVKLGIGDDAAVLHLPKNDLLFTCDCIVEGVHFDLSYFSFFDVGWRAACANLSDLAAMGGHPYAALVTLGIRSGLSEKNILELYKGMRALLSKFDCPIVGGDITRSPKLFVDMAMLGAAGKKVFTRSGANAGELVVVTGDLGRSLLGYKLLSKSWKRSVSVLTEKHLRPLPRLKETDFLQRQVKIGATIDISDGLSSELHHLSKESGVGFEIEEDKIPLHPALVLQAKRQGLSPTQLALSSGEEYELLFTCSPSEEKKLMAWNRSRKGTRFTIIGQVVKGNDKVWLNKKNGWVVEIVATGYKHF